MHYMEQNLKFHPNMYCSNPCMSYVLYLDQTGDISQALQKLTEPKVAKMYNIPSLSNVVHRASSRLAIKPGQAPIKTDTLNTLLYVRTAL